VRAGVSRSIGRRSSCMRPGKDAEVAAPYTPQSPHRPHGLTVSILPSIASHNAKVGSSRESLGTKTRTNVVSSVLSSKVRASGTMMSRSSGGFPTRHAGRQSWGNSAGLCGPRRDSLARPSSSGVSGCENREAQSNVQDGANYIYVTLRTLPPRRNHGRGT
jgi:hypothetical protein